MGSERGARRFCVRAVAAVVAGAIVSTGRGDGATLAGTMPYVFTAVSSLVSKCSVTSRASNRRLRTSVSTCSGLSGHST